jgi:hypothetical protein
MTCAFKVCLATFVALLVISSSRADDIPTKQTFVIVLQQAVRTDDKAWLADHTRYPLRFYGRLKISVRNKASFVKNYALIIGKKLRIAVLAQDPESVFENWQGMMVGEGNYNIWVRNAGDGLNERYELITINDVE